MKKNVYDRRLIEQVLRYELDDMFGYVSLDEVIKNLSSLKEQYSEFENLTIKTFRFYEDFEMKLIGFRLENDEEYEKRITTYEKRKAATERRKSKQVEKEREQLVRLIEKHGNPNNW